MEVIGTVQTPEGQWERISGRGDNYEAAHAAMSALIPEGHQLIVIRTNDD